MNAKNGLKQSVVDVVELQANLDDVSPEVVGDALAGLLEAGALDVWTVGVGMKKGRPGVMVCVLCEAGKESEFAKLMIELTGTFGVRYRNWQRVVLEREHVVVKMAMGEVRVKVGRLEGQVVVAQPEYEDVKKIAEDAGVSVRVAMDAAKVAAAEWCRQKENGGHD